VSRNGAAELLSNDGEGNAAKAVETEVELENGDESDQQSEDVRPSPSRRTTPTRKRRPVGRQLVAARNRALRKTVGKSMSEERGENVSK